MLFCIVIMRIIHAIDIVKGVSVHPVGKVGSFRLTCIGIWVGVFADKRLNGILLVRTIVGRLR